MVAKLGYCILQYVGRGDETKIWLLLENRADISTPDESGLIPLHWAVYGKGEATAQLLIEKGGGCGSG